MCFSMSARRGRRPTSLSSYAPSSRAAALSCPRELTASGSFPRRCKFPERLQDRRLKADFPSALYDEVQRSFEDFHTLAYFRTTPRQMFFGETSMKQWIDAGAVIGMGTDSGTPMNFHTEALWREIKVFVDLGMSPQAAISAATRVNARILGKLRELGTIEAGKLADIIVVNGDPLFNIMALADVETVIKGGRVFQR